MLSGIGLLCNPSSARGAAACAGQTACACGALQPGEGSNARRLLRTLVFDSVGYLRGWGEAGGCVRARVLLEGGADCGGSAATKDSYLVDPASSHMLVSKIKPCMCKYELIRTVKLRMAH